MRLVVYGTLAPGRENHHQISGLGGRWLPGTIRGRMCEAGWAQWHDCPGMVLDELACEIDVFVFESADLPSHWPRLDDFEGSDYRRIATVVQTAEGQLEAFIYEALR
jgi:gamma-glutamylcyclotransferase (GGCT)/AIG2-like uncharacterized protein YtfP